MDTIFALSSGAPPAAIAIVRVSGPQAGQAIERLAGKLPKPRKAVSRSLRDDDGQILDNALLLWLPGPGTATGEDIAEFHLHGGRAVVAAVEKALKQVEGCRQADAGEFTRRAFANGKIDLAQAEGLADLLSAETELQRRSAMAMAGGALSQQVEGWRDRVLALSARVESVLDFSDEDDVSELPYEFFREITELREEIGLWLDRPRAETLRNGYRVVLAGPPNAGKSTLFNALIESEAAIAAPSAGTTRDILERSVSLAGIPFTFVDTAGLRQQSDDAIETIGIERAQSQMQLADCVLWLGKEGEGPEMALEVDAKSDLAACETKTNSLARVSGKTGHGLDELRSFLINRASGAMPRPGDAAVNARQREILADIDEALDTVEPATDLLVLAEKLRLSRSGFDRLIGRASTEDMLDGLFGRFCIGK